MIDRRERSAFGGFLRVLIKTTRTNIRNAIE